MSPRRIEIPERLLFKSRALGARGEQWLADLGRLVEELEEEWRITVGRPILGGSGGYVAEAVTHEGLDVVVKLSIPDGLDGHTAWAYELATLRVGDGHGYVRVLRHDETRRAMLQERLGRSLDQLALPVAAQIGVLARTMPKGWFRPPDSSRLKTGPEQAESVAIDIMARWERLDHPCPRAVVDRALAFVDARIAAFDAERAVFIHGDAHPANVLESVRGGGAQGEFTLIDPDGMLSEPAHDLAIPLRDWTDELFAGDPKELARSWCTRFSELTGVEARAIWEWAYIERVSTGLFLVDLGDPIGMPFLSAAALLADAAP